MSIIKTEAFVLKSFRYGETSKIVTLFTEEFGKLNAIVKGARNYKSRICGTLETMNYINVVVYYKENRELQLLSNAEYKKSFKGIINNFEKLETAFRIIEFLNKSVLERETNKYLFALLMKTFSFLNDADKNYLIYFLYFQMKLTTLLGFGTEFNYKVPKNETFMITNEFTHSNSLLSSLALVAECELENINELNMNSELVINLIHKFEILMTSHTFEYNHFKSNKVFQELKN